MYTRNTTARKERERENKTRSSRWHMREIELRVRMDESRSICSANRWTGQTVARQLSAQLFIYIYRISSARAQKVRWKSWRRTPAVVARSQTREFVRSLFLYIYYIFAGSHRPAAAPIFFSLARDCNCSLYTFSPVVLNYIDGYISYIITIYTNAFDRLRYANFKRCGESTRTLALLNLMYIYSRNYLTQRQQ